MRLVTFSTVFAIAVATVGACGGAESTDLFAGNTTSASSASSSSSGGSGSTSGGSSSSSSTSTSGGSGNPAIDAGPKPCKRAVPSDCAGTELCKVTACGDTGICAPRPPQQDNYAPVCGCDGVTYWNEAIANAAGISKRTDGACALQALTTARCGGLNGVVCAGFRRCNLEVETPTACAGAAGRQGTCWGLPDSCPPSQNGTMRRCTGGGGCRSYCDAIKDQAPFYSDTINCP